MATGQAPAGAQTIEILNDAQALARATPEQLETAIDRRNTLMDKIRDAALKATWSEQWTNMDGKPWPTAAAAETIARRCAVKVHGTRWERVERHDDAGAFFFYVYTGTVELPGGLDSAEVVGTCSSRDQFIGTEAAGGRELSEINEDDVMKAAYSNMVVNGVMRLLGLRGLTWERLTTITVGSIVADKAAQITHRSGAKGGGASQSSTDVELKFGRGKGKKLSEVSDEDVRWYMAAWQKDLADPAKEKYHRFCKRDLEIAEALLASRANAAAGTAPSAGAAGEAKPSPWQRIRALDRQIPDADLKALVKDATKKTNAAQLTDEDVALVAKAIEQLHSKKDDIPF